MPLPHTSARYVTSEDLTICFTLGSLCFIRRWYDLENLHSSSVNYTRFGPPSQALLIATLMASTLMAMAFLLLTMAVRQWGGELSRMLARCGFLVVLISSLESMRRYYDFLIRDYPRGPNLSFLAIEAALGVGLVMLLTDRMWVFNITRYAVIAVFFILPAMLISFAVDGSGPERATAFQAKPSLPLLPSQSEHATGLSRRVLWIVFDEFDQRIAFEARSPVDLPEFDRLRAESLVGSRATQTHTTQTRRSQT